MRGGRRNASSGSIRIAQRHRSVTDPFELTLGRTHETEDAGLGREANYAAARRVVISVDDPVRRDTQPEWSRHFPASIDQHLVAVSVLPELYRSAIRNGAAGGTGARLFQALKPGGERGISALGRCRYRRLTESKSDCDSYFAADPRGRHTMCIRR